MFKKRFMPFFDADDGFMVANGGDSPTPSGEETPENQTPADDPEETESACTDDYTNEHITKIPNVDGNGDITQTQAFSKRLNEKTANYEKKIAELEGLVSGRNVLYNALAEAGYEGSEQEIADMIVAQQKQTTPEEIKAERERQIAAIEDAIKNNPTVKKAQEVLDRQTLATAQAKMNEDLRQIQLVNPKIKALSEIESEPEWNIVHALAVSKIASGGTLADAYKEVHSIIRTTKQSADTKSHLNGIGGSEANPDETVDIPSSEIRFYQNAFPDSSAKELRQKYNNILKRQRGEN